jgi:hypothetical protein
MKKIFFFVSLLSISFSLFADLSGLSEARELAEKGIIVDQSSMAQEYRINTSLDLQESAMYRLSDSIIRQEVLGIALKLRGIDLPSWYTCRDFYRDTGEWWVCRAAELSADYGIVTRANLYFRPRDVLTLAEALGITFKALDISLSNTSTSSISGSLPAWQKRLILTIQEKQITLNVRDDNGRWIAVYDPRIGSSISGFNMSHRLTRGQFFQLVITLLDYQDSTDPTAHCTVYNDGCNDCVRGDEWASCTKRMCIWQGIPSCSECESGYILKNNRCVRTFQTKCVQEGWFADSGYVYPEENMKYFECCSGLKSAPHKEADTIADIANVCIREGDGYCDPRYESIYNSSDCRTTSFDDSICQSYYDGCNSCSKSSNGQIICTMRACVGITEPAYCTTYKTYTPINEITDRQFSDKILNEIRNYTKDLSCTSSDQCKWKLFGQNPCGSSSIGVQYSSKNIDMTLFETKTSYYTNMQKLFNQSYPVFGTCALMAPPPPLSCVNGICQ